MIDKEQYRLDHAAAKIPGLETINFKGAPCVRAPVRAFFFLPALSGTVRMHRGQCWRRAVSDCGVPP
jgi:hypothetical protein